MPKPKLTIIGLGRTGASLGLSLKKTGAEIEIVGHDKARDVAQAAVKLGAVDKVEWNLFNACEGAGMIVLALPFDAIRETIDLLAPEIPAGVIVTDTSSLKLPVIELAKAFRPGVAYIGGHPVLRPLPDLDANLPDAALLQNAVYCLTPTPETDGQAVEVMNGLVGMIGAKTLFLDAAEHDGLVAGAEHLAYVLSATLLQTTTSASGWRELNKFAGDEYARATQLATLDPASLRALLLAQNENITRWIDLSIQSLKDMRAAILAQDAAGLEAKLIAAQRGRDEWIAGKVGAQEAPDLGEVRGGPMRMFLGGMVLRGGRDKKK